MDLLSPIARAATDLCGVYAEDGWTVQGLSQHAYFVSSLVVKAVSPCARGAISPLILRLLFRHQPPFTILPPVVIYVNIPPVYNLILTYCTKVIPDR